MGCLPRIVWRSTLKDSESPGFSSTMATKSRGRKPWWSVISREAPLISISLIGLSYLNFVMFSMALCNGVLP